MRAGIYQGACAGLTPRERVDRLRTAIDGSDLDLVVCPELFASGYNVGELLHERAEPRGGPVMTAMGEVARAQGTAIVYGYPERDGDTVYNAAAVIGATGELVANHRKTVLPPGMEPEHFAPGDTMTVFSLDDVRCCALICYEAEFPEAVRAAAEAGVHVIVAPTALAEQWRSVAMQLMPTRAFENGVWLLYANHAGVENGARYLGASCIAAPDGSDAARAGSDEELIVADLDMERVTAMQARLPYLRDIGALRAAVRS
ncbi:MAG: carbon-nitrogen hydrolase family protein [Pseudomonadota bacterium]